MRAIARALSVSRIAFIAGIGAAAAVACAACPRHALLAGGEPGFLSYRVTVRDASLEVIRVECRGTGTFPRRVVFRREAAEGNQVEPLHVAAADARGAALPVSAAKDEWIIRGGGGDFTLAYEVVLTIEDRSSPDIRRMLTALESDRCRFLGKDIFLVPDFPVQDGIIVDVDLFGGERLAASCPSVRRRMIVPDAGELALVVAAAGAFREIHPSASTVPVTLAIAGRWDFEDAELAETIGRIAAEEIALFGSSPRDRYLVVCDANPLVGRGGFDHYGVHFGGGIVLLLDQRIDRSDLFGAPMAIVAHELFHNWNGEALRPASDTLLWFTEGITSYYAYRALVDAGVITEAQYDAASSALRERFGANALAAATPLSAAANRELGDKEMVNLLYDGGFLAAAELDRCIAAATGGRSRLIDVLRWMYEHSPDGAPIDEAAFLAAARSVTGCDLSAEVDGLVRRPAARLATLRASALE